MRWGDMDAYGHINNVQIVRMLEEARIAAFGPPRGAGLPGVEPHVSLFNEVAEGTMALIVDHRIRYVRTLEYRNSRRGPGVDRGHQGRQFRHSLPCAGPRNSRGLCEGLKPSAFVDEATGRVLRLTPDRRSGGSPSLNQALTDRRPVATP